MITHWIHISFQSTQSGAGEQFLLLDCRARACAKRTFFSQTPVWCETMYVGRFALRIFKIKGDEAVVAAVRLACMQLLSWFHWFN